MALYCVTVTGVTVTGVTVSEYVCGPNLRQVGGCPLWWFRFGYRISVASHPLKASIDESINRPFDRFDRLIKAADQWRHLRMLLASSFSFSIESSSSHLAFETFCVLGEKFLHHHAPLLLPANNCVITIYPRHTVPSDIRRLVEWGLKVHAYMQASVMFLRSAWHVDCWRYHAPLKVLRVSCAITKDIVTYVTEMDILVRYLALPIFSGLSSFLLFSVLPQTGRHVFVASR